MNCSFTTLCFFFWSFFFFFNNPDFKIVKNSKFHVNCLQKGISKVLKIYSP